MRAPVALGSGPHVAQFWGALGSYIDFTAPGAAAWWREHVTAALLSHAPGLPLGVWCDNNEFEGLRVRGSDAGWSLYSSVYKAFRCA